MEQHINSEISKNVKKGSEIVCVVGKLLIILVIYIFIILFRCYLIQLYIICTHYTLYNALYNICLK